MMASLSRQLAQWVVGLRYEDLPPEVVDRAKDVTLHSLASVLLGSQGGAALSALAQQSADAAQGFRERRLTWPSCWRAKRHSSLEAAAGLGRQYGFPIALEK
jgi:2-methylcitrate dehydratase PrpD